jgi:NADH-quinone oxidoreductase subunit I
MAMTKEDRQQMVRNFEAAIGKRKAIGALYGFAKGLSVTLRTMLKPAITQQYPHEKPDLPPRSRGLIALKEENCTVCMLCSRECPDWCIYIDSHKETVAPKTPGARPRTRNMLDRFAIDFALCMYCGICVEVCPFDALFWSPHFEYSTDSVLDLTHEIAQLNENMLLVPPPPELEEGAEEPKEFEAEPAVYESAGTVVEAAPAPAAAPAEAAPAEAPAEAEAPAAEAAPEPPKISEPPQIDQEAFDEAIAAGKSEREARALAKKAWILKKRKEQG